MITTKEGDNVIMKSRSVSWSSGVGGTTRGASTQITQSQKLARLNKVLCVNEYDTDQTDNWVGKIWEWK